MSKEKQEQFMGLYQPVHDRFERFCRARCFGEMDHKDLMNDTLLIAFEKFETLQKEQSFLPFLMGISIRVLGNFLQKKKTEKYQQHFENTIQDQQSSPSEKADIYFLHLALSQLSSEKREALLLFEIIGMRVSEIAQLQNISEAAIRQRLKRSRIELADILKENKRI